MTIENRINLIKLYEIYNELLTKKKKIIFEYYYFEDLSINEISDILNITKNAVYNSIKKTEKELSDYEYKLKILENYNDNIKMLKFSKIDEKIINNIK